MKRAHHKSFPSLAALVLALSLAACGGGGADNTSTETSASVSSDRPVSGDATQAAIAAATATATEAVSSTTTVTTASRMVLGAATQAQTGTLTAAAASHFLAQATFGPTPTTVSALTGGTRSDWLTAQFAVPQTPHLNYVRQILPTLAASGVYASQLQVFESFWQQSITGQDQLRQRVAFALSQIFVISVVDTNLFNHPAGVASYYDMLGQYAFGNFRDLLQGVALHPMMGMYLSHMRNQKETSTRVPDENFAREVMQLMSIGLYQLNTDGTVKTSGGKPIETYTHDDVAGLAKVFTGWSWYGPDQSASRFGGGVVDPTREWMPMQNYPAYHSTSQKSFLGATVSGGGTGASDLKVALDTLFNHPNVGPFIGRQLIQRLVSSNPSPAYVGRVAAAFNNNGAGVRGDMRAVLRAVLTDTEASDTGAAKKLREPVLRLSNWMRAFNAKSTSGRFLLGSMDDPLTSIGQTPLRSPSVFNFFRPSYTPPNTTLSAAGLVSPEMQLVGEPSVTGYLNYMQSVIPTGIGIASAHDVLPDYTAELALAANPAQLVDRVTLLLTGGSMSTTLRNQIISALNSIVLPANTTANASQLDTARKNRVYMAIYLTMASPEYLAQR